MLFPAFLIGAAFGVMVVLGLAGPAGLKNLRPVVFSAIGSAAGIVVFLLTDSWWPPVVGPFILCPAFAAAAAAVSGRRRR